MRRSAALPLAVLTLAFPFLLGATPAHAADFGPVPHLLRDISPGPGTSDIAGPARTGAVLGSQFIFGAYDGTSDLVWRTDGTSAHTVKVSTAAYDPKSFVTFAGSVYFAAHTASAGEELWKTNGTSAGTVMVADLDPGSAGSNPTDLTVVGNTLYFVSAPSGSAQQLYRLGAPPAIGPPAFPSKVTNNSGTVGISDLAPWGNKVLFASTAGGDGNEPWISDGSTSGTKELRNIATGTSSSDPADFTAVGSSVYFSADAIGAGRELWRTDGTGAIGTTQVADLYPGGSGSNPQDLYALGGKLLFTATSTAPDAGQDNVWVSDGTVAGTKVLADHVRGGGTSNNPAGWTAYKGWVYFSGSTAALGSELYRTQGTPASTAIVKNINTGTSNSTPLGLRVVADELYFNATDATHGAELWRSNGTAAGTQLVRDIAPGKASGYPELLGALSNTLIFEANDVTHGAELWAYTARTTRTKGLPRARYSKALARAKKIHVKVRVTATGSTPTGTVVIKHGTKVIGTGTLSGGVASVRITVKLPKGRTQVRAYYAGNVRGSSSASVPFKVTVR
jgi:ELWxxDGT repeat protein